MLKATSLSLSSGSSSSRSSGGRSASAALSVTRCLEILGLASAPSRAATTRAAIGSRASQLQSLTKQQIKSAYRAQVKRLHPDVAAAALQSARARGAGSDDDDTAKPFVSAGHDQFIELQSAMTTLLEEATRVQRQAAQAGDRDDGSSSGVGASSPGATVDVAAELQRIVDECSDASSVPGGASIVEDAFRVVKQEAEHAKIVADFCATLPKLLSQNTFVVRFRGLQASGSVRHAAEVALRIQSVIPTLIHRVRKGRVAAEAAFRRRRGLRKDQGAGLAAAKATGGGLRSLSSAKQAEQQHSGRQEPIRSIDQVHIKPLVLMGVVEISVGDDHPQRMHSFRARGGADDGVGEDDSNNTNNDGHLQCTLHHTDSVDVMAQKLGALEQESFFVFQRHAAMALNLEVFLEQNRFGTVRVDCWPLVSAHEMIDQYLLCCENVAIVALGGGDGTTKAANAELGRALDAEDIEVAQRLVKVLVILPPLSDADDVLQTPEAVMSFGSGDAFTLPPAIPAALNEWRIPTIVDAAAPGDAIVATTDGGSVRCDINNATATTCGFRVLRTTTCCDMDSEGYDVELHLHGSHNVMRSRLHAAIREVHLQHRLRRAVVPRARELRQELSQEEFFDDQCAPSESALLPQLPGRTAVHVAPREVVPADRPASLAAASPITPDTAISDVLDELLGRPPSTPQDVEASPVAKFESVMPEAPKVQRYRVPVQCFARLQGFGPVEELCFWELMHQHRELVAKYQASSGGDVVRRVLRRSVAGAAELQGSLLGPMKVILAGAPVLDATTPGSSCVAKDAADTDGADTVFDESDGSNTLSYFTADGVQQVPFPFAFIANRVNELRRASGLVPLPLPPTDELASETAVVEWIELTHSLSVCANVATRVVREQRVSYIVPGRVSPDQFLHFIERYLESGAKASVENAFLAALARSQNSHPSIPDDDVKQLLITDSMLQIVVMEDTAISVVRGKLCVPSTADMAQLVKYVDANVLAMLSA